MKGRLAAAACFLAVLWGAALLSPGFLGFVSAMGHGIPVENVAMDYLIGVTWAVFLGLSIQFWPLPAEERRLLTWGWMARVAVTLGFMLLYENYYSVDAYWYFDFPRWRQDWPGGLPFGNGNEAMYYLSWLHHQILPDSYHMMKVSFSLVGLVAVYIFYRAAAVFLGRNDTRIYFAMALFPSVLFWSSILGKDPIVLLGIALYVYGVASWASTGRFQGLVLAGLGIFETMFLRVWLGTVLLIPMAVFVLYRMRRFATRLIFSMAVLLALGASVNKFKEEFRIDSRQDLVDVTEGISHSFAFGGSGQAQDRDFTSIRDIALFVPIGAFSALFRPLPGEIMNPFGFMAGLEGLLLILMLFRGIFKTRLAELREPVVMWAIALILTWSSVYGLVSFQNLGMAVRFKLQILPVLLCLLLYLNRNRAEDLAEEAESSAEPEPCAG